MNKKLRRNRIVCKVIYIMFALFIVTTIVFVSCGNDRHRYAYKKYTLGPGEYLTTLYAKYGQGIKYAVWEYEMLKANGKEYGSTWYAGEQIILLEVTS